MLAASIIRDRPDDGGSKNLSNVGKLLPVCTAQHSRRLHIQMLIGKPPWKRALE
jgi:hypothetical protein